MGALRDMPIASVAELYSNAIDMVGRRFGNLLVLGVAFRRYYENGVKPQLHWFCRCVGCGHKITVAGGALRRGAPTQCLACSRVVVAEKNRARSRRVGDGRRVAQIAQATGLKLDTVYHRLIRGWKPHELGMRVLRTGERRASP